MKNLSRDMALLRDAEMYLTEKKQRNSSIEMMKIFSLFLIVLCHSVPLYKYAGLQELAGYWDLTKPTLDLQGIALIIYSHLGQIGNALFIVPSCYFLLENNIVKKDKIALYVLDTFVISIVYLAVFEILCGRVPSHYVICSLAPTTFGCYWFITCYIMLYAVHPWLNYAIEKMERKSLFIACVWMFLLYNCINFALGGKYYASQFVGFIVYYFFVAYWKLYLPNLSKNKKTNRNMLFWGLFGFIGLILTDCFLGLVFPDISHHIMKRLESFMNPFVVIICIATFNMIKLKKIHSKLINKISSTSLLVFVISNNLLVCDFVKPVFFEKVYLYGYYKYIVFVCLMAAVISFLCSIILALGYMAILRKITVVFVKKVISVLAFVGGKMYAMAVCREEREKTVQNNHDESAFCDI